MIKLQYILDEKSLQSQPLLNKKLISSFRDYGIEIVKNNPDVILQHQTKTKQIENSGPPIIILERIDSCVVTVRQLIKHPRVIALIKNTIFREPSLNNAPVQYGRYHSKLIIDSCKLKIDPHAQWYDQKIQLTENDLKKIEAGFTFSVYNKVFELSNTNINFNSDRSVDSNFFGTTNYGTNTVSINYHRKLCVVQLEKLKNKHTIFCGSGRSLDRSKYNNLILSSKTSVSPWGLGEACYRDFEAIYLGSILIKPDTSYVYGKQDIYQNFKYYIPCKINFSDLDEIIHKIKTNWKKYEELRTEARNYLIRESNIQKVSEHLSNIIRQRLS